MNLALFVAKVKEAALWEESICLECGGEDDLEAESCQNCDSSHVIPATDALFLITMMEESNE